MRRIVKSFLPFPLIFLISWLALAAAPYPEKPDPLDELFPTAKIIQAPPVQPAGPDESIAKVPWAKPTEIRGIYTTGWMAGSEKWFPRLVKFIDETQVNSLVIDVKDDAGTLSYRSEVPLAVEIGASLKKISDPRRMMQVLREHQIYPIARIVAFKDPLLAKSKPEWAVKDIQGGLWKDHKGLNWVDPYNKQVWEYLVDIAKEATNLGFQEVQFDYVRFTSDGDLKRCVYPYRTGQLKQDVIRDFLQYAEAKLKPYHIPVSADIFGLTTSANDDLGIGQKFEKIASSVDIVSPMVYPSHYALGTFGFKNPDYHPYETVFRGVSDAKKKLAKAGNTSTQIRPWLQDFSLGNVYKRQEVQEQIKAVHDAGVREWIFWNPSCRYDVSKYN